MTRREWHLFLHATAVPMAGRLDDSANSGCSGGDSGAQGAGSPQFRPFPEVPFSVSFEQIRAAFETLPGAYCEPDGAMGWNPSGDEQLGGTIHCGMHRSPAGGSGRETREQVVCIELFSSLERTSWRRWVESLGVDPGGLAIQLAEEGRFVSLAEFERMAFGNGRPEGRPFPP